MLRFCNLNWGMAYIYLPSGDVIKDSMYTHEELLPFIFPDAAGKTEFELMGRLVRGGGFLWRHIEMGDSPDTLGITYSGDRWNIDDMLEIIVENEAIHGEVKVIADNMDTGQINTFLREIT